MALVTYVPRVLPVAVLTRVRLPGAAARWLEHVPAAALAALLAPLVLGDQPVLSLAPRVLSALVALAVARWKRDLTLTVVAGVLVMYLAQRF